MIDWLPIHFINDIAESFSDDMYEIVLSEQQLKMSDNIGQIGSAE